MHREGFIMDELKGFETFIYLAHVHYRCLKCGDEFCGQDVVWCYHNCEEDESIGTGL